MYGWMDVDSTGMDVTSPPGRARTELIYLLVLDTVHHSLYKLCFYCACTVCCVVCVGVVGVLRRSSASLCTGTRTYYTHT